MKQDIDPTDVPVFLGGRRLVVTAVVVALVGLLLVGVGFVIAPQRTAYAYLTAFVTVLTTCMGALVFLATVHAMDAKWPVVLRRLVESLAAPLPILAVAFLPVVVLAGDIFPWVEPLSDRLPHHVRTAIEKKQAWLDVTFFGGRAVFYLLSWVAIVVVLLRWSARLDHTRSEDLELRQRMLSAAALPFVALTLTFAAFDWMMSLDPAWYSTIFGIYAFAGGFVAAIAVLTILTAVAQQKGLLRGLLNGSHYYALGRLLLAFIVFWAYIAFFQLMLIWIANRPEEVAWYLERTEHGWQWFALAIVVLHFVVPFLALLSYAIKWRPRALSVVAGIVIFAHWLEMQWIVVPAGHFTWIVHWVDFGALMLVGGACVAFGAWWLRERPMAPRYARWLSKGARYDSA